MEVFIGDWHAVGTSYGDGQDAAVPRAAGVPWTSDESYEWLPGSFFVLHRWDAQMGEREFKGAEIMGDDDAEGGYFTRMFDNTGHHPDYRASVDGEVWTFKEAQTRQGVGAGRRSRSRRSPATTATNDSQVRTQDRELALEDSIHCSRL